MDEALLALLRCPETLQPLKLASAELLRRLGAPLYNQAGELAPAPLEGALLREDGRVLYPICRGIPLLLVSEAIAAPAAFAL